VRLQQVDQRRRELTRKREMVEARIAALRKQFHEEAEEANQLMSQDTARDEVSRIEAEQMAMRRGAGHNGAASRGRARSPRKAGGRR
jgi:hypothetical protein